MGCYEENELHPNQTQYSIMTGHAQGLMNSYLHNVCEYQIDFFVYVGLDKRILM